MSKRHLLLLVVGALVAAMLALGGFYRFSEASTNRQVQYLCMLGTSYGYQGSHMWVDYDKNGHVKPCNDPKQK